MKIRVGQGYDIHRLIEGRSLVLGGLEIDYHKGADGHSDADVVIHALIDALLGATALGDIGTLFPDTNPKYRGVRSSVLLAEVIENLQAEKWRIGNVDVTVILQRPKLSPHIHKIRETLSRELGLTVEQVSVKAKTNEELDALGRGEAVAAQAVVLVYRGE